MKTRLTVLSFGAGVQSTTLLWLVLKKDERLLEVTGGDLPEVAVFADTQGEPQATYAHVHRMKAICDGLGFDLRIRSKGDLGESFMRSGGPSIPFHLNNKSGSNGILPRNCTNQYKVRVVVQGIREYLGVEYRCHVKTKVKTWVGISTDEIERQAYSRYVWEEKVYPLLDMGWSRDDCKDYLSSIGEPVPPKSACIYCPYHTNDFWRDLKANYPEDWAAACEYDEKLRVLYKDLPKLKAPLYVHYNRVELRTAPLEDQQLDMWEMFGECEGMCGV